jgi:ABC-type multidrug transport system ATPase subunit
VRKLRAAGTTVLLTTHLMDEAERLCDRLAIVAHGRLCAEGTPAQLVMRHLAREALELEANDADAAWVATSLAPGAPTHRNSDRVVVFAEDVRPWLEAVRRRDGGDRRTVIVRPANVEDVFLALTGARLGDAES